jgi:hypothetical protein
MWPGETGAGIAGGYGWVVVSDPIPAGSTILGSGLAAIRMLTQGQQQTGWAWPVFTEDPSGLSRLLRVCCQGPWSLEYTVRLTQAAPSCSQTRQEPSMRPRCSSPTGRWRSDTDEQDHDADRIVDRHAADACGERANAPLLSRSVQRVRYPTPYSGPSAR